MVALPFLLRVCLLLPSCSLGRCLWKGSTVALGHGVGRAVCITDGGMERAGAEQWLSCRLGVAQTSPLGSCFLCGDVVMYLVMIRLTHRTKVVSSKGI